MTLREAAPYIGRFAPSPTGPLHFGSLLAAVASYLQARRNDGRWLLRIEDIDPPRAQAGADQLIVDALRAYGFRWHGEVIYQSRANTRHRQQVDALRRRGLAYPCGCSRRQLGEASKGPVGHIYPGTCRNGCRSSEVSIRVRTNNNPVCFTDNLQGPLTQRLESESGDFIIRRKDGLVAYNLAVVVDDAQQGVTEIVRGLDLLDSTPRQIYLQQLLGYPTPQYLHIPVVVNADGQKLSKQTGAPALPMNDPAPTLAAALRALRQPAPPDLDRQSLDHIWRWAEDHWDCSMLRGEKYVSSPGGPLATAKNGLR